MAKGENIFKRKDGRWEARYVRGRELSGKICYGYCYGKTYKEAKEKVTKCRSSVMTGQIPPLRGQRHRFAFYCQEWLCFGKSKWKESTFLKYESMVSRHICPKLGGVDPLGLRADVVEELSRQLMDEGLSPKTVKDILAVLRSILKYTAKQFPGLFPQIDVEYPRSEKKEMRVLTREEQGRFVRYLLTDMDECKFGILLALYTGLRIGEVCALRWENISLTDRTLRVGATMQRLKDSSAADRKTHVVIGTPKSDCSWRTIPLTDQLVALCAGRGPRIRDAYILTGTQRYMEPRTLQYRLKKYTGECGMEGVHFHTLRHTFATRCVEAGFEIKSLSEILGHANTTITLERYVHVSMELKRKNMEKLTAAGF